MEARPGSHAVEIGAGAALIAVTAFLAATLSLGIDESYTLDTTSRNLAYAWSQAVEFELQAPVYFLLLDIWRRLSTSIFHARLFSIVCVALSIPVLAAVSRRFVRDAHPAWAVVAFVVSPFTVWSAVEARLYAMLILLSALALLWFHDGFLADQPRRRAQVLFALVATIGLYTQYYFAFLLVGCAAALLMTGRWRPLAAYLGAMAVVGVAVAPLAALAFWQRQELTSTLQVPVSWPEGFKVMNTRVRDYLIPSDWPVLWQWRGTVLALWSGALALWLGAGGWRRLGRREIALWCIVVVVCLCFLVTLRATSPMLMRIRHTAVLFAPVLLAAIATAAMPRRKAVLAAWLATLLAYNLTAAYEKNRVLAKDGDFRRVASWLQANEQPGQPIIVFVAEAAMPLGHHYTGRNRLVALPAPVDFKSYGMAQHALEDEAQIAAVLRKEGDPQALWLVQYDLCSFLDVDFHCELLEKYVDEHYTIEREQKFFHTRVSLLRRKDPPDTPTG